MSPSRSSTASNAPVDAPDGIPARANVPSSRATSTSTVGLPRESRISRAPTASMLAMMLLELLGLSGPESIFRDLGRWQTEVLGSFEGLRSFGVAQRAHER